VAKVLELPEQKVILEGISWETYEMLLADNDNRRVPRLAYDRGVLEAMSPSIEHERVARNIAVVVTVVAEEMGVDVFDAGSTTFRREDLKRGFEPDGCFYVQNERRIRGKQRIDLTVDPPPDLVIEVDITSPSLDKLPIYAQIGVPEVWRHDGEKLVIFRLEGEEYVEAATSQVLPPLNVDVLSDFVEASRTQGRTVWMRDVRVWARRHQGEIGGPPA
jgi:Uma2 family endonuclease